MTIELDLQIASEDDDVPEPEQFNQWVSSALILGHYDANPELPIEITIRIVDRTESQTLNNTYRQKDKPTNVLSFPFESPDEIPLQLLGDLVICAPIVREEATEQHKSLQSHWAHMVIHGCLHLIGFDHIEESDADIMESLETRIMDGLGYADPYAMNIN
ncbi:MAG: rRNA maturation RNase YbeY [Pseudomonadales bacterium]|nr:rRNA maturation RNase YbeY [Pseudomonadales bacterium]